MNDLLNKKCEPCEGGVLPFDISEIHKFQKKVDGWDVKKNEKQRKRQQFKLALSKDKSSMMKF